MVGLGNDKQYKSGWQVEYGICLSIYWQFFILILCNKMIQMDWWMTFDGLLTNWTFDIYFAASRPKEMFALEYCTVD